VHNLGTNYVSFLPVLRPACNSGVCHKFALYVHDSSILASDLLCLYSHQLLKDMDRCILFESKIIRILVYYSLLVFHSFVECSVSEFKKWGQS
jgi:hypothetical protein